MENKIEWYIKLAKKLALIKSGEMKLDDYINEVNKKIVNTHQLMVNGETVVISSTPIKMCDCTLKDKSTAGFTCYGFCKYD